MSTNSQPEQIILASWQPVLTFDVIGTPQQRGSKQARVQYNRDGKPVTKDGRVLTFSKDDNEKSKAWMDSVRSAAHEAWGRDLLDEPLALSMVFYFKRPKSHYRTGANKHLLSSKAPLDCMTSRDLAKLIRSTEDALTGVVWRDDKLVCEYLSPMRREYTTGAEKATITIYRRMCDSPTSLF
jgi:Holliday junction resolvase RusA-like endonuclease